jgi:ubiquinone/menaquinone biosynthesis C-methylase UbiE
MRVPLPSPVKRVIKAILRRVAPSLLPTPAVVPDAFMPGEQQWVHAHYTDVVNQFERFVLDSGYRLEGKTLLDIGSGDCLIDYGLLNLPLAHVEGLDIVAESAKDIAGLPERIANAGLTPPSDVSRFGHTDYDGVNMPFEDQSFDIVFSWSAFEHVQEVEGVLHEVRRVLTDDGFAFIQVFPWFASRYGSHLADHIATPFFHLREELPEVRSQLEAVAEANPDLKDFMLGHLWDEYTHLNHISADDFYEAAKRAGFIAQKARLISMDEDLSRAPSRFKLSELMVAGTMMILVKSDTLSGG